MEPSLPTIIDETAGWCAGMYRASRARLATFAFARPRSSATPPEKSSSRLSMRLVEIARG